MTHGSPARPTVVVLGGGYAGIQVARPLDDLADVVLVEPKDDFVHNVASLRAVVDPSWLERIYLPYTGLLGRGRVIRDRAVKADADRVVLASGAELFPDYLVLATGSGYPFPAKPDLPGTEAAHGKVRGHARGAGGGGPGAAARRGPGRHRARRGDQGGLAGQAGDAGRRGRRRARRAVPAGPEGRTAPPAHRPGRRLAAGQPAAGRAADRARRAGHVHGDHAGRRRGDRRHLVPLLRRRPGQRLPGRGPGRRAPPGRLRRGNARAARGRAGPGLRARRRVGRGPEQGGGRGRPPGARRGRQHPRAHHRPAANWRGTSRRRPASSCRSGPTAAPGSGRAARTWCRPRRWPSSRAGT